MKMKLSEIETLRSEVENIWEETFRREIETLTDESWNIWQFDMTFLQMKIEKCDMKFSQLKWQHLTWNSRQWNQNLQKWNWNFQKQNCGMNISEMNPSGVKLKAWECGNITKKQPASPSASPCQQFFSMKTGSAPLEHDQDRKSTEIGQDLFAAEFCPKSKSNTLS